MMYKISVLIRIICMWSSICGFTSQEWKQSNCMHLTNQSATTLKVVWIKETVLRVHKIYLYDFQNCKLYCSTPYWIQHDEIENKLTVVPLLLQNQGEKFKINIRTFEFKFKCKQQNVTTIKRIQLKMKSNSKVKIKSILVVYQNQEISVLETLAFLIRYFMKFVQPLPYLLENDYNITEYIKIKSYGNELPLKMNFKIGVPKGVSSSFVKKVAKVTNNKLNKYGINRVEIYSTHLNIGNVNEISNSNFVKERKKRQIDPFSFFNLPKFINKNVKPKDCSTDLPPIAVRETETILINFNQFSQFLLPSQIFTDKEDGKSNKLEISMVWFNNNALNITDWLQFIPQLQFVNTWATYNVYLHQPNGGYKFKVTAKDKCKNEASIALFLKIKTPALENKVCYYFVIVVESKLDNRTSFVHVLVELANILGTYYNDTRSNNIIIKNLQYLDREDKLLKIEFFDRTIGCDPCDVHSLNKRFTSSQNKKLAETFKPDFIYKGFTVNFVTCNGNSRPITLNNIPDIVISRYKVSQQNISGNLFYDIKDGVLNDYVITSKEDAIIVAFIKNDVIYVYQVNMKDPVKTHATLHLTAYNSKKNQVSLPIRIQINKEKLNIEENYFTLKLSTFEKEGILSKQKILSHLLKKLSNYLDMPIENFILINYNVTNESPQNIVFAFTTKNIVDSTSVPNNAYNDLKNKIFTKESLSEKFKDAMHPLFFNIENSLQENTMRTGVTTFILPNSIQTRPLFPTALPIKPSKSVLLNTDDNGAPRATKSIGPFNASFCNFFVYPLPEDLFMDAKDGNTRKLKLKLKTSTNVFVEKTSWIQIDTDIQVLYGFLKVSDYLALPSKTLFYTIVATNSLNISTALPFQINLPRKLPSILYRVEMTLSTFYDTTAPDLNEQLLLLLKVATYFGEPKFSWVNILSFSRNQTANIVTFGWTNCTISDIGICPKTANLIQYLSSKIILNNGIPSLKFASFLSPQYIIKEIKVSTNIQCSSSVRMTSSIVPTKTTGIKPRVANFIPMLNVYTTEYFTFKIPFDTFYDERDGYTPYLTLTMTNKDGSPISKGSWIQFNTAAQEIYAFLYVNLLKGSSTATFEYVLKASNSEERSTSLALTLKCIQEKISYGGLQVIISGSEYYSSSMNRLQVLIMFLRKYYQYIGKSTDIEITSFDRTSGPPGRFSLALVHNEYIAELQQCDWKDFNLISNKLSYWDKDVNPFLILNFLPEVVVQNVKVNPFGQCLNNGTAPQVPLAPVISNAIPILRVDSYKIFTYKIPENTFQDSIDGNTRNLNLYLLSVDGSQLPLTSWIYLADSQTIVATFYFSLFTKETSETFQFMLRAMNSKGLYVNMIISLTARKFLYNNHFQVTYRGYFYLKPISKNVEIIKYILEKFYLYLHGSSEQENTSLIDFQRSSSTDNQFSVTFSDRRFGTTCNKNNLPKDILSNFITPKGTVNPAIVTALSPKVLLTDVKLTTFDCQQQTTPSTINNTPPRVNIQVQPIEITFCQTVQYAINPATFVDEEQGNTVNLRVEMQFLNNTRVPSNFWLHWEKQTLSIYGNLDLKSLGYYQKNNRLLLKAFDTEGLSASTVLTLRMPRGTLQYNHVIVSTIATLNNEQFAVKNDLLFIRKLKLFFDNEKSFQIINKNTLAANQLQFQWFVCNVDYTPCPVSVIQALKYSLMSPSLNSPNEKLVSNMLPEINLLDMEIKFNGPCQSLTISKSATSSVLESTRHINPTESSKYSSSSTVAIRMPPTLTNPISGITAVQCKEFRYNIPANTFYDIYDGDTRNLKLSVVQLNNEPLLSNSWLQLDSRNQYLYGFLTDHELRENRDQKIKLRASNRYGLSTDVVLTVTLPYLNLRQYTFSLMFSLKDTQLTRIQIIRLVSEKLNSFIPFVSSIRAVSMKSSMSNIYTLRWSDCDDVVSECMKQKIEKLKQLFYIREAILRSSFIYHMQPEINIFQMTFNYDGLCLTPTSSKSKPTVVSSSFIITPTPTLNPLNIAPTILKAIPVQTVFPHIKFNFQLPEDTFFDVEDGLTKNLKVSVYDNNMVPLNDINSWLIFHVSNQTFEGVLTLNQIQYQQMFTYNVLAMDSGGLSVTQKMVVKIEYDQDDDRNLVLETRGSIYYSSIKENRLNVIVYDKLYFYFINQNTLRWRGILIHSIRIDYSSNIFHLKWSIYGFLCQQDDIALLKSKMFSSTDVLNVPFAVLMNPYIIITETTFVNSKFCTFLISPSSSKMTQVTPSSTPKPSFNTPPIIFISLPILYITACQTLQYKIPENVCYDSQDGFTPNLELRLVHMNYSDIAIDSWIQLDKMKQEIYGILTHSDLQQKMKSMFTYYLLCIDKEGASVSQKVNVMYNGDSQSTNLVPSYEIQMQSYVYMKTGATYTDIQITWINKLKQFLNDKTTSGIQIKNFRMSTVLYPQIIISWYNCSIVDACSAESKYIYNQLFNTYGGFNYKFTKSMVPEFVVISGKFLAKPSCFSTSSTLAPVATSSIVTTPAPVINKPPVTLTTRLTVSVKLCGRIKYQIPTTTFYDFEDGYTPNLVLKLFDTSYKPVATNSYVKLNETTQTLYGVIVYNDYKQENNFVVRAYDRKGLQTDTFVVLKVEESLNVEGSHLLFASGALYFHQEKNDKINLLHSLTEKISSFYGDKHNNIAYRDVYITRKAIEFTWMNCTLMDGCQKTKLHNMKNRILQNDLINTKFIASLAPMFVITRLTFKYTGACIASSIKPTLSAKPSSYLYLTTSMIQPTPTVNTRPVSLKPIWFIDVKVCESFSYRIPFDTFQDVEDGDARNLKLSLLTFDQQVLSKTSWVQFVESTQVIYGHIRVDHLKEVKTYENYVLKAEDSSGLAVTTSVILVLPPKPEISFRINVTVTRFFNLSIPDLTVQLFLVSKICSYVNDVDLTNVLVISFQRTAYETSISWTNCSFIKHQCNGEQIKSMRDKFHSNANLNFQVELSPQYKLISSTTELLKECNLFYTSSIAPSYQVISSSNVYKSTSSLDIETSTKIVQNRPPQVLKAIPSVKVTVCESFAYHIPNDIFFDEDGKTSALRLEILYLNGSMLSTHSWIQFNENLQVVFGVIKIIDIKKQPIDGYKYLVKATDSHGLSTMTVLSIDTIQSNVNIAFYYKMQIKRLNTQSYPIVNDLFQLVNKLTLYFRDNASNTVKTIDLTHAADQKDTLVFSWTNCTATSLNECPHQLIAYLNNKMFDSDGLPNIKLKEIFLPQYFIENVELVQQFQCKPSTTPITTTLAPQKPIINKYIESIFAKRCDFLSYKVPEETFFDPQDGYTRNLFLTLTFSNGTAVPSSYWLKFHTTEQRIIGYPIKALQYGNVMFGYYLFKLTATDKDYNSVSTIVQISIIYNEVESLQNITLEMVMNFDLQLNNKLLQNIIESRIFKYYGDENEKYVQVRNFTKTNNRISVTWSNCSLDIKPCDKMLANQIQDRIKNERGTFKSQFAYVFLPEFTVQRLDIVNDKSCGNILPSTIKPSKSFVLPITSSSVTNSGIYASKNITLPFSFCGDISFDISNVFYDMRGGNDFKYSLRYTDNLPVTCNSWIQYDETTNSIYGTAIRTNPNTPTRYLLHARNDIGETGTTNVIIDTSNNAPNVSYSFSISFHTALNSLCDAELLKVLKNKIEKYFNRVGEKDLSVIYFSRGTSLTRSYVMFSNCSLNTTICNYEAINYISEMLLDEGSYNVTKKLTKALQPDFDSLSILDEKQGVCSKVVVLAVGKTPGVVCAYTCGLFRYDLSSELFVNRDGSKVDGLIIELTELNGKLLPPSSWIEYNENGSLVGLVSEAVILNEPSNGYSYLLTAYAREGSQTQTTITIKICGKKPTFEKSITLEFVCKDEIKAGLPLVVDILNFYSNQFADGMLNSIYVVDFKVKDRKLDLTWSNCSSGNVDLTPVELQQFKSLYKTCELSNSTFNDNKDYSPVSKYSNLRFKFNFCSHNRFKIPNDTFFDQEDGSLFNLRLKIMFTNRTQINNQYWISLHEGRMELYILPSKDTQLNTVYEFILTAYDSTNQTASISLYIEIFSNFPPINVLMTSTFVAYSSLPLIVKVQTFFEKLNKHVNSKTNFLLLASKQFENNTIFIEFANCSLNYTPCPYKEISIIESVILYENKGINADLVLRMFPDCLLESFTISKVGPCLLLPNSSPTLINEVPVIHITDCSYVKYKIPNNTFYDVQDGWTNNLKLTILYPNSCWFQFDVLTQTIFALVTTEALNNQPVNGYRMLLRAMDSRQTYANATITIKFDQFKRSSYKVAILFEIREALFTSCVREKVYLLETIHSFYNDSTKFSLKETSKSADKRIIELTITKCSMRYAPCDYITMDAIINKIQTKAGLIKPEFVRYMLPYYNPRFIAERKDTVCSDSNNKSPVISGQIRLPKVFSNSCITYNLSESIVTDLEDGSVYNLNVSLLNDTTGYTIGNKSWIFLNKTTKQIYIMGSESISNEQQKFLFSLVFTDSRGASVAEFFSVMFENSTSQINSSYVIEERISNLTNNFALPYFICKWKAIREFDLNMPIKIKNVIYNKNNNTIKITWSDDEHTGSCYKARNIVSVIQKYFRTAALQYIIHKTDKCLTELPPNVTINNIILTNPCKPFVYILPDEMFTDVLYGNTSSLEIQVNQTYPSNFLSNINFNTVTKTFTGILLVDEFIKNGFIEYNISATNPLGLTSFTSLKIYLDIVYKKNFEFVVHATYYDLNNKDILKFLKTSFEFISIFLNKQEGVLFYNVTMTAPNQYIIQFSPCVLSTLRCTEQVFRKTKSLLIDSEGKPTFEFISAMKNIVPRDVVVKELHKCSNNESVKIGFHINKIEIKLCGDNRYKVPLNAFLVQNEDDIESVLLVFKNSNSFQWIHFNSIERTFTFQPSILEVKTQPLNGYELILEAIDSRDNRASQNISLHIVENLSSFNYLIDIETQIVIYKITTRMQLKDALYKRISKLLDNEKFRNIIIYDLNIRQTTLNFTLYDCQLDKNYCQTPRNNELLSVFRVGNEIVNKVKDLFLPEFFIININGRNLNRCENISSDVPYVTSAFPKLNLSYFNKIIYRLPKGYFSDKTDGVLKGKAVKLLQNNGTTINKDNYVYYDDTVGEIRAFITQKQNKDLNEKYDQFKLQGIDSDDNEILSTIIFNLPNKIINNLIMTTVLKIVTNTQIINVNLICNFAERLNKYFNNKYLVTVIDFKQDTVSKDVITITWSVDTFTKAKCNKTLVEQFIRMVSQSKAIYNPYYVQALGINAGFIHVNTTMEEKNYCLDPTKNMAPVTQRNVTLNVAECGVIEYKLPFDLFIDLEDGNTTNLDLRLYQDENEVSKEYWLQLDNDLKLLTGIANENVRRKNLSLVVVAIDSGGLNATTFIKINFKTTGQGYINEDIIILTTVECLQTNNVSASSLVPILASQLLTIGLSKQNIHLKGIRNSPNRAYITWNICGKVQMVTNLVNTVNKTIENCTIKNVTITQSATITQTPTISTATANVISRVSVPVSSKIFPSKSINILASSFYDTNQKPVIVNNLPNINFYCGEPYLLTIPENTFYDYQDGADLMLKLVNTTGDTATYTYVSFVAKKLVVFVSIKDCFDQTVDNLLLLQATDKDNNSVIDYLGVTKSTQVVSCCISVSVDIVYTVGSDEIGKIFKYFVALNELIYKGSGNEIVLNSVTVIEGSILRITHTNKLISNATCFGENVDGLFDPIFVLNGIINGSFLVKLEEFNIITARKNYNSKCNATATIGDTDTTPVLNVPTSGKQTTSEEWFLYLLPLFVLAFIIFAVCIWYYICRYCYKNCVLKKTAVDEKPYVMEVDFDDTDIKPIAIVDDQKYPVPIVDDGKYPVSITDGKKYPKSAEMIEAAAPVTTATILPSPYVGIPKERVISNSVPRNTLGKSWDIIDSKNQGLHSVQMESYTDERSKSYNRGASLNKYYATKNVNNERRQLLNTDINTSNNISKINKSDINNSTVYRSINNNNATTSFIENPSFKHSFRRSFRHALKLPTLPSGPPPPYSPPRKHRIFKQNVIPQYYERYFNPQKVLTPVIAPTIHSPKNPTIIRKRRRLPSFRKSQRYKVHKQLAEQLEVSDSSSVISDAVSTELRSESPIEVRALLKGKRKTLLKILRKPRTVALNRGTSFKIQTDNKYGIKRSAEKHSRTGAGHSYEKHSRTVSENLPANYSRTGMRRISDRHPQADIGNISETHSRFGVGRITEKASRTGISNARSRKNKILKRLTTPVLLEHGSTSEMHYPSMRNTKRTKSYFYEHNPLRRRNSKLKNITHRFSTSKRRLHDTLSEKSCDSSIRRFSIRRRKTKKQKNPPTLDELLDAIPEEELERSFSPLTKQNYRRSKQRHVFKENATLEDIDDIFSNDSLTLTDFEYK